MAIYLSPPAELAAVSTGYNERLPYHGHLTHRMPPRAPVPAMARRLCAPPSLSTFFHLFEASCISTVRDSLGRVGACLLSQLLGKGVTRTKLYIYIYIYIVVHIRHN